ncbi:hypothetical protein TRAPUB_2173 [Trametes pubescens]|uniref:Uncharacterized protein n=1 Tax=Trametes pubescens TaxID=154538 RepID=A0A1M2VHB4_TRAPU|nr:hypothetical protein TRAPUB_2173 [Trametes pubescens]
MSAARRKRWERCVCIYAFPRGSSAPPRVEGVESAVGVGVDARVRARQVQR